MGYPSQDRFRRYALPLVAVATVGLTAFGLHYARTHRPPPPTPRPAASVLPPGTEIRLAETEVTGRDAKGKASWNVHAARVDTDRSRARILFDGGIAATLLDSDGSGTVRARVTAPKALFTEATRSLEVSGTVECRVPGRKGEPDLRLTARELRWDVGQNRVSCEGEVVAYVERGTIRGEKITVDLRTRALDARNVRADFTIDESSEEPFPLPKLPL